MKKLLFTGDLLQIIDKDEGVLSRKDFITFRAASAHEAIALHRDEEMDVIISGAELQDMSGYELCRLIREDEEMKGVSIILVCSNRESDRGKCTESGANECLTYPLDPHELFQKIVKLLDVPVRKHTRVLIKVSVKGKFKTEPFFGMTQDMSTSGLLLETDKVLAKGDAIECAFFVPNADRILAEGEVMRVIKTEESVMKYGVRFRGLQLDSKKAIEAFIKARVEQ